MTKTSYLTAKQFREQAHELIKLPAGSVTQVRRTVMGRTVIEWKVVR